MSENTYGKDLVDSLKEPVLEDPVALCAEAAAEIARLRSENYQWRQYAARWRCEGFTNVRSSNMMAVLACSHCGKQHLVPAKEFIDGKHDMPWEKDDHARSLERRKAKEASDAER